jgi:hypothetical protein
MINMKKNSKMTEEQIGQRVVLILLLILVIAPYGCAELIAKGII